MTIEAPLGFLGLSKNMRTFRLARALVAVRMLIIGLVGGFVLSVAIVLTKIKKIMLIESSMEKLFAETIQKNYNSTIVYK